MAAAEPMTASNYFIGDRRKVSPSIVREGQSRRKSRSVETNSALVNLFSFLIQNYFISTAIPLNCDQ